METNYSMALTANTTTYTYVYSPSNTGTYTINIYATDNYTNVTKATGLSFLVSVQSSGSSGGGGGGGGYYPPTPTAIATTTPAQSFLNLSLINFTEGARNVSDVSAINDCLTTSFFLSNQCTGAIVISMKEQTNWGSLLAGALFGAFGTLFISDLVLKKKRNIVLDSLIYSTVTMILVLSANLIGVNFTYLLNFLMNSSLPVWLFLSSMMWSFLVTIILDSTVFKKPILWKEGVRKFPL